MPEYHDYAINSREYLEKLFRWQQEPLVSGKDYVPTHLPSWNRLCGDEGGGEGLAMGWHVLVAGNAGYGKSIFAINFAATACRHDVAVGYVSLEMSHRQLAVRHLAIRTGVTVSKLERGKRFELAAAESAKGQLEAYQDTPFCVNDQRFRNVDDVLGIMHEWKSLGVRAFVIDFMQLMGHPGSLTGPDEVAIVCRAISDFAYNERCLTLGLSQYNRVTASNYVTPPTIQGLHGGGSMEQGADQVMLIDHSRYEKLKGVGARTWVILGKNRHGGTGSIPVWMSYNNLQVREADQDEESLWPGG